MSKCQLSKRNVFVLVSEKLKILKDIKNLLIILYCLFTFNTHYSDGEVGILFAKANLIVLQILHCEWRKIAKKLRRKRIRQNNAKIRHDAEEAERLRREQSPTYASWLEKQREAEEFQAQEEAKLAVEREAEWLKAEKEAQKEWRLVQEKLKIVQEERARQNALIRLEWEREQKKLRELKEQKEREEEEKQKQQELLQQRISDFIVNGGDVPEELKVSLETNPNKQICPFFKKTSACRFKDSCSRNHIRPGISRIILVPNFYSHYSLEQTENEYGSDSRLEYETYEMYEHFREFFFDIVPELEKYGHIRQLKVCCNQEPHLRGNVYVEYSSEREAIQSYKALQGRWYGGKQLNVEFCNINSWKSAICGLFFKKRCPKGSACNFLHIFRNPNNLFNTVERDHKRNSSVEHQSDDEFDGRNWRWSESPERILSNKSSKSKQTKEKYTKNSSRNHTKRSKHSHNRRSPSKHFSRSNYNSRSYRKSRSRSVSR